MFFFIYGFCFTKKKNFLVCLLFYFILCQPIYKKKNTKKTKQKKLLSKLINFIKQSFFSKDRPL